MEITTINPVPGYTIHEIAIENGKAIVTNNHGQMHIEYLSADYDPFLSRGRREEAYLVLGGEETGQIVFQGENKGKILKNPNQLWEISPVFHKLTSLSIAEKGSIDLILTALEEGDFSSK